MELRARRLIAGTTALTVIAGAGVWAGFGVAGQTAAATGLTARLGAAQEVPKPAGVGSGAQGAFTAGLARGTLTWKLTFRGLTGRATASHIHVGARGRAGGVLVALCGPCRPGARGAARVNGRTTAALLAGTAYVNVYTARNPAGEIRGQVGKTGKALVPPPATTTNSSSGTTTDDGYYPGG